ncbi:MAG TPA: hypothetical protein DCW68_05095 [Rhodospirillaceae bacterium]|nr:MAG: hypothetical protein A2018_02550 [Alphaproteobacteria bacterium GWF2_58_20]HAU29472.1 hypothetical protein [Rhodospirillaceae bacterium]
MNLFTSLFQKKNAKPEEGAKRSHPLARFMFNPELGGLVTSVKDVFNLFIQLIGYVFVIGQLLPANHPVFSGDIKGFSAIGAMLVDASANLELKWKKVHQILLFYAVVGLLIFAAMLILSAIFNLAIGLAHAQEAGGGDATSMFMSSKDRAGEWLKCVFPMDYAEDGTAIPCAVSEGRGLYMLAQAVGDMLAFYAKGCLVLAGVIVGYTTISIVVEAAHEGVFFGKRHNALWAPVRLVWALLLLVPLQPYNFSLGQIAIIKIAGLGSGMATNAWDVFIDKASASQVATMARMADTPAVRGQIANVVQAALAAETCVQSLWVSYRTAQVPGKEVTLPYVGNYAVSNINGIMTYGTQVGDTFDGQWDGPPTIEGQPPFKCGSYVFDATTNNDEGVLQKAVNLVSSSNENEELKASMRKAAFKANRKAFDQMLPEIRKMALTIAKISIDPVSAAYHDPRGHMPKASEYEALIDKYVATRFSILQAEVAPLAAKQKQSGALSKAGEYGWLGAGGWMLQISQATSVAEQAITSMVNVNLFPDGLNPQGTLSVDNNFSEKSPERTMFSVVQKAVSWTLAAEGQSDVSEGGGSSANASESSLEKVLGERFYITKAMMNYLGGNGDPFTAATSLGWALIYMAIAGLIGAGLTGAGVAILDAADSITTVGLATGAASSLTGVGAVVGAPLAGISLVGKGVVAGIKWGFKKLGTSGSKIISMLSLVILIPGIILAVYLPLLPTLRFLFAFTAWFLAVLEAVFAVPVVALAHLRTDGAGLAGPMGLKSYIFLLQIFVRPILIICGLVGSLLVFNVTVRIINLLFLLAIGNYANTSNPITGFLFSLGALLIYTSMLYTLANMCFKLIDKIPDDILTWIGQGGIKYGLDSNIGSAYRTTQALGGATKEGMEKGAGALEKSATKSRVGAIKAKQIGSMADKIGGGGE